MIFLLIANLLSKMGLFKNDEFYFYSKKKIPEANKQHPPPKKKPTKQNKTKNTIEPTIKNTKNRHENPKQNHTKKPHKFTKITRYKLKSTYQRC